MSTNGFKKVDFGELYNIEEAEQKKKKRCVCCLLLLIPVLVVSYFILRKTDEQIVPAINLKKPLSDNNSYKFLKLPNDMEVVLVSDPSTPHSAASLIVKSGAFYDLTKGLAHFCEHMLFLGSKTYPDGKLFDNTLKQYSGLNNAFTGYDRTGYFFDVDNNGFLSSLKIFAAMFDEPLFDEQFIEKEINAVNSEHEKNINSNIWIIDQLVKDQANKKHPFSQFATGTKETLGGIPAKQLREELVNYFNAFYIGKNMKLSIVSNYTISELEKIVNEYFSYKKEENKEALKVFERKIVGLKIKAFDDTLSKILWYQSPTDTNEIDIYFKLNEVMSQYKLKPQDYFKYLLLNSGEKSLISILKEKNLIITLTGDIDDSYNTFSTYKLRIVLTPEGVNQYDYVLEMVFDYLELIQEQKINSLYYLDIKRNSDTLFNFKEKMRTVELAIELSGAMLNYEYEDLLYGGYTHSDFKADAIKDFIKQFTLKNAIVILSTIKDLSNTKLFAPNSKQEKTLEFYNKKYIISPFTMKSTLDINRILFAIRGRNKYITSKKQLLSPCSEDQQCFNNNTENEYIPSLHNYEPNNLTDTSNLKVYYKIDKSFKIPKVMIVILFKSPYFLSRNIKDFIYLNLIQEYIGLKINNELFDAIDFKNNIMSFLSNKQMKIVISCYSDLAKKIVSKVKEIVFNSQITDNEIEQIKERLLNNLESKKAMMAFLLNDCVIQKIIVNGVFISNDLILNNSIRGVSLEHFTSFFNDFKQKLKLEILITGDTSKEHSTEISNEFSSIIKSYQFTAKAQVHNINKGTVINYYMRNFFDKENNHATTVYYQIGMKNIKSQLYVNLFEKCIGNLFFGELRTKKQLGYVVKEGILKSYNVLYLFVTVQGTAKYPDEIDDEINEVIQIALDKDCSSNFEDIKKAQEVDSTKVENNLNERTTVIVDQIESETYQYDIYESTTKALREIQSYEEVKTFMKNLFVDEVKRIAILNYAGVMKDEEIEERISKRKESKYTLNPSIEIVYTKEIDMLKDQPYFE